MLYNHPLCERANLPNKFPYKGPLTGPVFCSVLQEIKTKGARKMERRKKACVGIVGSRSLPSVCEKKVRDVVSYLLQKEYRLSSGGAVGADQFCVEALLQQGQSSRCVVYSPWRYYSAFPKTIQAMMKQFKEQGGSIQWGPCGANTSYPVARLAFLNRNKILVDNCTGIVAFINKDSRGSIFTIKEALKRRKKVVVFPFECAPPSVLGFVWHKIRCAGPWQGSFVAKPSKGAQS